MFWHIVPLSLMSLLSLLASSAHVQRQQRQPTSYRSGLSLLSFVTCHSLDVHNMCRSPNDHLFPAENHLSQQTAWLYLYLVKALAIHSLSLGLRDEGCGVYGLDEAEKLDRLVFLDDHHEYAHRFSAIAACALDKSG